MTKGKATRIVFHNAIKLSMIALTTFNFVNIGQASEVQQNESHAIEEGSELHLSHDLRLILNQEMRKIEEGMKEILPAISAGNWETIASVADKIEDSFILKQRLTQRQIEELHHSLSAEFVEMDQNFHSTAGKLAQAAHRKDGELVSFYFYKLHSQCVKCHSKYASRRFPNFQKIKQSKSDHH